MCWLAGGAEFRGCGERARGGAVSCAHGGSQIQIGVVSWARKWSVVSRLRRREGFRFSAVARGRAARISVVFLDFGAPAGELRVFWFREGRSMVEVCCGDAA